MIVKSLATAFQICHAAVPGMLVMGSPDHAGGDGAVLDQRATTDGQRLAEAIVGGCSR